MNSKMVLGQYYNSNSWVHRLDPRLKIIALFIYMIAIFLVNNIYALLGFGLNLLTYELFLVNLMNDLI